MQFIHSRQNKTIKDIIALRDKKHRRKERCFTVEGARSVREALLAGMKVEKICFSSDTAQKYREEVCSLLQQEVEMFELSSELFRMISETETPQGILAVVRIPGHTLQESYRNGFRGLILDNVQDPGNAGTMIRSAHALGFDAVVTTSGSVDIYNSKVLRSTMGSVFHIPVIDSVSEKEIVAFCREQKLQLIAAGLKNAVPVNEADLTGEFFLVIGNEGRGISEFMLNSAAAVIYIPMPGGAESFNAGVAASILMYESNRQKLLAKSPEPPAVFTEV